MLNRTEISENCITFEDFSASSQAPFIGQQLELPMNAFGSVVARFEVTSVRASGDMLIAEAKKST